MQELSSTLSGAWEPLGPIAGARVRAAVRATTASASRKPGYKTLEVSAHAGRARRSS